jgi:hypothetical protein
MQLIDYILNIIELVLIAMVLIGNEFMEIQNDIAMNMDMIVMVAINMVMIKMDLIDIDLIEKEFTCIQKPNIIRKDLI